MRLARIHISTRRENRCETYGRQKSPLRLLDRPIHCHELLWREASFQQSCSRHGRYIRARYSGVTLLILFRKISLCAASYSMPRLENTHLLTFNHWAQHKRARHVYPDLFVVTRTLKSIVALTEPFLRRRNIRFRCLRSNFFRLCGRRIFEEVVKSVTAFVIRLIHFFAVSLFFRPTLSSHPLNYTIS